MNILVCVKPVPDPEKYDLLKIDPVSKRLVREGIPAVVNPADKNALEFALQLKAKLGAEVTVISMAPMFNQGEIKQCLAMGADEAYIVSDRAFGGADTYATTYTLFKAVEKIGKKFDLVLAGAGSADGGTAHVLTQLAEWMGIDHVAGITAIDVDGGKACVSKMIENGHIDYEVALPAAFSVVNGSNTPRYVTAYGIVDARDKKIEVITRENIGDVDDSKLGLGGSPTVAGGLVTPDTKRKAIAIEGTVDEIAGEILAVIKHAGL